MTSLPSLREQLSGSEILGETIHEVAKVLVANASSSSYTSGCRHHGGELQADRPWLGTGATSGRADQASELDKDGADEIWSFGFCPVCSWGFLFVQERCLSMYADAGL